MVGDICRMGRNTDCDIQFHDDQVSRDHARIVREGDQYVLEDTKSRNGVQVNHKRVTRQVLKDGDLVTLGQTTLKFVAGAAAATAGTTGAAAQPPAQARTEPKTIIAELSASQELFGMQTANLTELQKAHTNLKTVYSISEALAGTFDIEKVLDNVLDKIFEVVKADRGVIMLMDEADGSLRKAAQKVRGQKTAGEISVSQTILRYVLEKRASVLTTDAARDQRFAEGQSILIQNIQSAACIPLICRNNILGVLQVESTQRAQAFSRDDLHLLTGIAGQAAIAIENAGLLKKAEEDAEIRTNLQRYLAPQVAQQVIQKKVSLALGGQAQKITVLFSDVRGFTRMTEEIGATEIVATLNQYFERMVTVIFNNRGTLDKFVGDAIMALWGVPIVGESDTLCAVRAGVEMQRQLYLLNLYRRICGQRPLYMGVGLNTGEAVVGNMGASRMMQYTAMGGTVNQASRIEGKTTPGQVLISESTFAEVHPYVQNQELPPVELKGIAGTVKVWTVTGLDTDEAPAGFEGLGQPLSVVTYLDCTHDRSGRSFVGRGFDVDAGREFGVAVPAEVAGEFQEGDTLRIDVGGATAAPSVRTTSPGSTSASVPAASISLGPGAVPPVGPLVFQVGAVRPSPPDRLPPFALLTLQTIRDTQH
jgi:adenylate cyclase